MQEALTWEVDSNEEPLDPGALAAPWLSLTHVIKVEEAHFVSANQGNYC